MAFKFLRVKFGSLPAYSTACRYAIKPKVYSLFEYDDDLGDRMSAGRALDFSPWRRRRRACFCGKSCFLEMDVCEI
jgi:hypothetical protein